MISFNKAYKFAVNTPVYLSGGLEVCSITEFADFLFVSYYVEKNKQLAIYGNQYLDKETGESVPDTVKIDLDSTDFRVIYHTKETVYIHDKTLEEMKFQARKHRKTEH